MPCQDYIQINYYDSNLSNEIKKLQEMVYEMNYQLGNIIFLIFVMIPILCMKCKQEPKESKTVVITDTMPLEIKTEMKGDKE